MPGNFKDELPISKDGCLSPSGPLELDPDETVLRLDVWIWQKQGACMAKLFNFPDRKKWTIPENHHENHKGDVFLPGPAFAMGIMVSEMTPSKKKKIVQWTEVIDLVKATAAS